MAEIETSVVVGLYVSFIAAAASLGVAVYNQISAHRSQRELAQLKERLDDALAERNALREYQFEARKRLYTEIEPLLFQLAELSESALNRIQALARTAAQGKLQPDGSGWLSEEGYYTISTIYRLLAPAAIFRLIQRKLTIVDLSVDPFVNEQYRLIKTLYISFTDHIEFARLSVPPIEYTPHDHVSREQRRAEPTRYLLQGIIAGRLDNAVEALSVSEPQAGPRLRSYGEFEAAYYEEGGEVRQVYADIVDLVRGFHPLAKPVFWRILLAHALIYRSLTRIRDDKLSARAEAAPGEPVLLLPDDFDWRRPGAEQGDQDFFDSFETAERYLAARGVPRARFRKAEGSAPSAG